MENMLNTIDQVIVDDEIATLDYEDMCILLEEEGEILPFHIANEYIEGYTL